MSQSTEASTPSEQSQTPTVTPGGVMPGGSESSDGVNAYPGADATLPGTLPRAVAESMGDPTGNKGRDQLLVVAQAHGIADVATMNRQELADVLKTTLTSAELAGALTP